LFLSDNGGYSWPVKYNGDNPFTSNLPLRAGKGSVYEGGIRIPLIVKSNASAARSKTISIPVIIEDVFPTILDIAGISNYKTIQSIDGISLLKPKKNRSLIFHYPHKWVDQEWDGVNYRSAIIKNNWKLIYDLRTGNTELYDLTEESEKKDLALAFPQKTKDLSNRLIHLLKTSGTSMPYKK
jgi:arylsulfatase A-like enzyme